MIHKLYKVKGNNDGQFGKFRFRGGQSEWLNKRDADHAIASGVGVRCMGDCAPYYAVLEVDGDAAGIPLPENYAVSGRWEKPKGTYKKSIECEIDFVSKQGEAPSKGKTKKDASTNSS